MVRLDSITVEGFKSIKSIECPFEPINIVIGANGSGKSNFIGAFSFLREICNGRLRDYVIRCGGAENILHFGSKTTSELTIHVSFGDQADQYRIRLIATDEDGLWPASETVYYWNRAQYAEPYDLSLSTSVSGEAGISQHQAPAVAQIVQKRLRAWTVYHFHDTGTTSPMKKTGDVDDNRFLRHDGANLPAFLYFLSQKHQESFDLICRTVRLVAPFFDEFHLQPQALNEDKIRLEWRHRAWDVYLSASSLSDGTLRFIALATLLLQPATLRPSVILLDEPELGLHPYAITLLASLIKQASIETQLVVTTQSAPLLDHFTPEGVLVAERQHGATKLTRLKGQELDDWLLDYGLGQLWEKNHFGGRPAPEDSR